MNGHAHKGGPEGKTGTGIPVYNVSRAVLKAKYPDKPPVRLIEIDTGAPAEGAASGITAADKRNPARRATDRAELAS